MNSVAEATKSILAEGSPLRTFAENPKPGKWSDNVSHEVWICRHNAAKQLRAVTSPPVAYFWRCTNRREEFEEVKSGKQIVSKDHRDGTSEGGMSVAAHLGYSLSYKYAYKVQGTLLGEGADSEPVLVDVEVVSDLLTDEEAWEEDSPRREWAEAVWSFVSASLGMTRGELIKLESYRNRG